MIKIKYESNPKNIQEVELTPPKEDSLITFMKTFLEKEGMQRPCQGLKPATARPGLWAKKPAAPAGKKPPTTPETKKVWRKKSAPMPSPPSQDAASSS